MEVNGGARLWVDGEILIDEYEAVIEGWQTSLPRVIRGLVQSSSSENGFGVRVYLPAAIKDLAQLVVASFSS